MAAGPAPSITTSRVYQLNQGPNNTYTILNGNELSYNISDTSDNAQDDLGVLGDIQDDTFFIETNGFSNNFIDYVAQVSDGSGLIGVISGQGPSVDGIYLFTDRIYADGATIATSSEPFTVVCYCTGTLIRTARGDVPVERLLVGDLAETASGAHRPIRWIGHRSMNPRRHPRPDTVTPVRIRAHALGENKPVRDLIVSPGHAIALDILGEVLIPASALINGATIVQEDVERVTYWHIELDSHDLLVAENLPAESYLDMGNRGFFAHSSGDGGAGSTAVDLTASPDACATASRTHANFCRPFHDHGPLVKVVRAQTRRRAEAQGWHLALPAPFAGVHLEVDGQRVQPNVRELSACFVLDAGAKDVWLISPTSVPRAVGDSLDGRTLGLCLIGLSVDDGLGEPRAVALDDPRLSEGFHAMEAGWRWTAGRARLALDLWSGLEGVLFLRVDLVGPSLPHWIAPETTQQTANADITPQAVIAA